MKVLLALVIVAVIDRICTEAVCPNSSGKDWDIDLVFAHQDCDKFYKCFNGKPLKVMCPRGLYFSTKYWRCDWKYNVNCSGRNVFEQTDPIDGDEITDILYGDSESEPEDVDSDDNIDDESDQEPVKADLELFQNGCPINPSVEWRLPHEEDCNQFYACIWAVKLKRQCPPYLHFNKKLQVCDWPRVAGCAEEN